ncbi:hypothetical protein SLEP1_g4732 [Rubroshorea leprosula]|uniref:Uncharacterized protein n=1 Tax=Rubroshorea leprosula TaxID=152421 RepID=A0AAV5HZ54_9ROSI|nr:hypothetical protein SLEP1_g4732 [Rubroshorea leprosula]
MINSEPCALVGSVSRVYGVCRVSGFGFWGVTQLQGKFFLTASTRKNEEEW